MSNYLRYKNKMAFHPGYFIEDFINFYGITQKDFADRVGTTAKNLCLLIKGDQALTTDMAKKLSSVTNMSVEMWMNIQRSFDEMKEAIDDENRINIEDEVASDISYSDLHSTYALVDLPRKKNEQKIKVRHSLGYSNLASLSQVPLGACCSRSKNLTQKNIVRSNIMIIFAENAAIKTETPSFNRAGIDRTVEYALTQTTNYDGLYSALQEAFKKIGIAFFVLPNLPGSKLRGATKRMKRKVMLLVNNTMKTVDTFYFTLLHEIAHIKNKDWGASMEEDEGEAEERANRYAEDMLIPPEKYREFFLKRCYDRESIIEFASSIGRDPGIVVARLQKDNVVRYDDNELNALKHTFLVEQDTSICIAPFDVDLKEALG